MSIAAGLRRVRRVPQSGNVTVRRHKPDYQIVLWMGLLMLLGLVVMYAIGPQRANVLNNSYGTDFYTGTYFFIKQTISLGFALAVFFAMVLIPYKFLLKHAGKILLLGFALCLMLLVLGNLGHVESIVPKNLGAYRWFSLGPLGSVQPAEFLKFGVLIFVAGFLGTRAKQGLVNDRDKTLIPLLGVVGLASLFIIGFQKDMGTGIALVSIVACMMLLAGLSKRIGFGLLILGLIVGVGFIGLEQHRIDRITTFLSGDDTSQSDAGNYHIAHAKIAIGSGSWLGVGIGNSVQATGYLPEAINDSVFAIMGETFGFVGLVGVLTLFLLLLMRLLKVADHLVDIRLKLIVGGVFGWLAAHVILNVAAMIGIFPLTGITLPLLSFGGTSMVFIAGALGLAFQLSQYTVFGSRLEDAKSSSSTWGSRRVKGAAK